MSKQVEASVNQKAPIMLRIAYFIRKYYPDVVYKVNASAVATNSTKVNYVINVTLQRIHKNLLFFPHIFIMESKGKYHGLCLYVFPPTVTFTKEKDKYKYAAIFKMLEQLNEKGYRTEICIGIFRQKNLLQNIWKLIKN